VKKGWTRPLLRELLAAAEARPRDLLWTKEPLADERGLKDSCATDEDVPAAMIARPVLVDRPIVVTPRVVALCRAAERVSASSRQRRARLAPFGQNVYETERNLRRFS